MKSFFLTTLLGFMATTALAQYTNQSAPFKLVLTSANETINGSALFACHEGAGIEGACAGNNVGYSTTSYSTFYFNTSSSVVVSNATAGVAGYLVYTLEASGLNESEPMGLSINPASNVALPLFEPSTEDVTPVAFDTANQMNIQEYTDDTVSPPTDSSSTAYYRWYVCLTNFEGYTYETLSWVLGEYPPQNPSCTKVGVERVFL